MHDLTPDRSDRAPRLLLVRHAQSEWNASGRWQGAADPPLSATGRAQAAEAGTRLVAMLADGSLPGPVGGLWSSDLERAAATAAILGDALGWPEPPRRVVGIREHDVGEWSGLTRAEIDARWPGQVAAWAANRLAATPGGERRDAFDQRVREAVGGLVDAAPAGLGVVVTHGGVLRAVARWIGVEDRPMANLEGCLLGAPSHAGAPALLATMLLLGERPTLARDQRA